MLPCYNHKNSSADHRNSYSITVDSFVRVVKISQTNQIFILVTAPEMKKLFISLIHNHPKYSCLLYHHFFPLFDIVLTL